MMMERTNQNIFAQIDKELVYFLEVLFGGKKSPKSIHSMNNINSCYMNLVDGCEKLTR